MYNNIITAAERLPDFPADSPFDLCNSMLPVTLVKIVLVPLLAFASLAVFCCFVEVIGSPFFQKTDQPTRGPVVNPIWLKPYPVIAAENKKYLFKRLPNAKFSALDIFQRIMKTYIEVQHNLPF